MKIAMIGQKGIPSRSGGVEIHVEEIAERLVKMGHDMTVYCRKSYCENVEGSSYKGIRIRYIPSINTKHLDAITYTFFSTMHALFSGIKVFHYHALGPSTLAFIPKIFGKKVVSTVHGLDWQRDKWGGFATKFLKFGEYASVKFTHKTISVSETHIEYFKKKYNKEITYIPNGVNKPEILEPKEIEEKFGLEKDKYILFLARLVPEKGAHYLIEAYKKINTDFKLVIAGGGSHSSDYEEKLKTENVGNDNIVFTGFVKDNLLRELFSNAYLYVLPSDIEGLPIALLEAMSYGLCCLTSDIPENKLVIDKHGFTFRAGNCEDLKDKLEYLFSNRNKIKGIGRNAEEYVFNKYNWNKVANQTNHVYKSLLSGTTKN
jgi:glycosyltransferase involved in cell wall biosynthesis